MATKGLPVFDAKTKTGLRCSGWGVWATGDTRQEAFANWQQAVKDANKEAKLKTNKIERE